MPDQPQPTRFESGLARRLHRDRVSRRAFMGGAARGTIVLGSLVSLPGLLAACAPAATGPTPQPKLRWLNWPAYIDIDEEISPSPTQYPSINTFIAQTGIDVEYNEGLLDNAEFLAQYAPSLRAGSSTGWDVMSPGGWVVERMARNGWLVELDHAQLPNWTANCADYAKGLWFDPQNKHSLWWQGGITGIAYDPELTGREITEFDDLLDPAFAGRVGGFSDMRDMFGLALLALGVQPANATIADVTRARDKLVAVGQGHFRGFYGNEYYDALAAGDLAISVAWSGDVSQMNLYDNPNVKFLIPPSGGMRWNDNLVIPKGATQVANSLKLLDYWYTLAAMTTLEEYIGYFTPVKGVKEQILADAQAARDEGDTETADLYERLAPTVVPSDEQIANTYTDKVLTEDEEAQWNTLFEGVLSGLAG
jgi:spermidine/putrescine transport system substrate-binding protein